MEDVKNKEDHFKPCARCKRIHNLNFFHRDYINPDGRKYICKSCTRSDGKIRYKKRKAETQKKGLCIRYGCKNKPHGESSLCQNHFYMTVSQNTLNDYGFWKELKGLAKKQNYSLRAIPTYLNL